MEETIDNEQEKKVTEFSVDKPGLEGFLNRHKRNLSYVLGGLIVVILGIFAYRYYYLEPQEQESQVKIFRPERYFEADSFKLALKGNGAELGFENISDDYGMTKSGNLSNYYSGVILLQQGKYDDAIDHLKKFKTKSKILGPISLGAIGDAYVQLKEYSDAADYYMKAAKKDDNKFTAPRYYKKAGLVFEELKRYSDAVDAYQIIKDKYNNTIEGSDISKYLGRAQAELDNSK
jgi:tetratricopeptide (TPR) repeat protein